MPTYFETEDMGKFFEKHILPMLIQKEIIWTAPVKSSVKLLHGTTALNPFCLAKQLTMTNRH